MKCCHNCGAEWTAEKKQPGIKEFCTACSAYLHCCMNCRFYEPSAHNACAIPTTEWVPDKAGANFCDEFEFADLSPEAPDDDEAQHQARQSLDGLFGGGDKKADRSDFDRLFGE